MRMTHLRRAILDFLARQPVPVTLFSVMQADGVRGHCSATTVYRTLMLFKEAGVVRLVGTTQKATTLVLNTPGDHQLLLVCRHCGRTVAANLSHALTDAVARVADAQGFESASLDVELHCVCPHCRAAREKQAAPSKLAAVVCRTPKISSATQLCRTMD